MHFSTPLVAVLSLASEAAALAAPRPQTTYNQDHTVDNTDTSGLPTGNITDYPAWECKHRYDGLWSTYLLRGRNWGYSDEGQVKGVVKKAGAVTEWDFDESQQDGKQTFNAKFRLPLKSAKRLEKSANKFLGIHGHKHGGVKCPKVDRDDFVFEHWDFHFSGMDRDDRHD